MGAAQWECTCHRELGAAWASPPQLAIITVSVLFPSTDCTSWAPRPALLPPTLFGNGRTHTGEVWDPVVLDLPTMVCGFSRQLCRQLLGALAPPVKSRQPTTALGRQTVAEGRCSWK